MKRKNIEGATEFQDYNVIVGIDVIMWIVRADDC